MTDENDDRAVGFLNGEGLTQAVIVGNARRHHFSAAIGAGTQRGRKAKECAEQAQGSIAIGGCSVCHRAVLVPYWWGSSVSINDKAVADLVASNRFDTSGNAVNSIDLRQQCRLRIRCRRKPIIGTRQLFLGDGPNDV